LIGQLAGGFLSDRLYQRVPGSRPLLVAVACFSVWPAALALTRVGPLPLALVCYGVTQLARGFAEPNIYGTNIDATTPGERGSAQGFLLMLNFIGGAISPIVVGWVIHEHGHRAAIDGLGGAAAIAG